MLVNVKKGVWIPIEIGKPAENCSCLVQYTDERMSVIDYTTAHGWNTSETSFLYPLPDEYISAWQIPVPYVKEGEK